MTLSIRLHIPFYFYFRFGSIFVYLTACSLFIMNHYCMHWRWKKTLKLSFLTPKRFVFNSFLSQTGLFFLFLCLCFLCFFVSDKAFIFLGVLPLFCFLSSHTTKKLIFFVFMFVSLGNFFLGFSIFCYPKLWIFWDILYFVYFVLTTQHHKFFCAPHPSLHIQVHGCI